MTYPEVMDITCSRGLVQDLNPGPLTPEARIIPLDQRAGIVPFKCSACIIIVFKSS